MPASRAGAALVALTIGVLPAGSGARADELLVMPYACTVSGGVPVLMPGKERGYRILGRREQRRFTACSPVNPALCRHWTVHRFDLDCDGTRVPWVSVVAAAGEVNRRAWLMVGRLHVRMGPRWSLPADDPCAEEPEFGRGRAYRSMRRYCADRLALAPPPVVEMPFGFAPMLGIDGIFVKAAASSAAPPPPLPPIVAAPPPDGADAEPPRQKGELPPLPRPPREALAEAPAQSPSDYPQAAIPQPPRPVPADRPAPQGPKAAAADRTPAPKLAVAPPPQAPPVSGTTAADPKPAPRPAAIPAAPAEVPSRTAPETDETAITLNPFSVLRGTTVGVIVAFAGLAFGLLAAFALARRREHKVHARVRRRDVASRSFEGKPARVPQRPDRARVPPNAPALAVSRARGDSAAGALAAWGNRIPETRVEALQVLGIGVAPSSDRTAIKKVVDALRVSWHPDFAKDEADRQLRELRSKQINAAWELLQSQRAEA